MWFCAGMQRCLNVDSPSLTWFLGRYYILSHVCLWRVQPIENAYNPYLRREGQVVTNKICKG